MKEFSQAARKLRAKNLKLTRTEWLAEAMALGAGAALNISQYADNPQLTDLQAVKVAAEAERLLDRGKES